MKKVGTILILSMFLISLMGFVLSANNNQIQTGQNTDDSSKNSDNSINNQEQNQISTLNRNRGTLTQSQIQNIVRDRNRLKVYDSENSSECPFNCTCTGSTTKCDLASGRQMTIQAGNSGNTIVQVNGIEAQTKVQLYKEDGKLYGQFQNNITRRIMSPEQVQEKVQQKLQLRNCSCENIVLNEDGTYDVETQKQSKFLGLFKVREKVRLSYDAETGELLQQRNSWWGFLAKDVEEEFLLGATCGTVSPTGRDECCKDKGYDVYDSEIGDCVFS